MPESLKAVEVDVLTGEVTERDLTNEERTFNRSIIDQTLASDLAMESKVLARQSALTKLAALGLTEEEIAAL
jgi:hypothetical protein